MATINNTTLEFFSKATPAQWSYVLSKYKDAIKAKAARRAKKGDELIRIDTWYQEQLPKLIHSRKELYITHEELVQVTKWKLMREKYRPSLIDLVKINTEKAVLTHSKKAFKRMPNLSGAIGMLTCLKGVGPASASAILAACFPEEAPFMADECMLSTPGVETMDYTTAEYLNYALQLKKKSDYLKDLDPEQNWTPHKVELSLWSHFVASELEPSLLTDLPPADDSAPRVVNDNETNKAEKTVGGDTITEPTPTPNQDDSVDSFANLSSGEVSNDVPDDSYSASDQNKNKKEKNDNGLEEPPAKKLCM